VLFPETWVPRAALGQLGAHVVSLRANPPIKPGTKDPYEPPN
jgi:arylsulfatase